MTDNAITGTISRFDPVQGFGVITADDGQELRFDVGICRFGDPRVGEAVRFQLGPSRLGGQRVAWVERAQARRVARASVAPPTLPPTDAALLELLSTSDGPVRELLEELVRRRATHFRTLRGLYDAILRADGCKTPADAAELAGDLRDLYASLRD
jgi:cold shock CspA family protein